MPVQAVLVRDKAISALFPGDPSCGLSHTWPRTPDAGHDDVSRGKIAHRFLIAKHSDIASITRARCCEYAVDDGRC